MNENDQRRMTNDEHWSLVVRRWSLFTEERVAGDGRYANRKTGRIQFVVIAAAKGLPISAE
jgi:hypothetical protein